MVLNLPWFFLVVFYAHTAKRKKAFAVPSICKNSNITCLAVEQILKNSSETWTEPDLGHLISASAQKQMQNIPV